MNSIGAIDFHTHYFPKELSQCVASFSTEQKEPFWGQLMDPSFQHCLQGWVSPDEFIRKMDDAGVEKSVIQGWYWENFDTCIQQNRWTLDMMKRFPDRIEGYLSLLPTEDDRAKEELEWGIEQGFKGIGEIHPTVQKFSLFDEEWLKLADIVRSHHFPILFHITEPVGRDYSPREETSFRELQAFIERSEEQKIILAHWGGLVFLHHLNNFINECWKNVYYDMAATPLLYREQVVSIALQVLPSDRILFGSDFPLKVYPNDPDQPEFARFLRSMKDQIHSAEIWKAISHENARKLLNPEIQF